MSLKSVMGASLAVIALTLVGCNSGSGDTHTKATKSAAADAQPILRLTYGKVAG